MTHTAEYVSHEDRVFKMVTEDANKIILKLTQDALDVLKKVSEMHLQDSNGGRQNFLRTHDIQPILDARVIIAKHEKPEEKL
jgi:hypothetical protein